MNVLEMALLVGGEFGVSVDLCRMGGCYFVHVQGYDKADVIPGVYFGAAELREVVSRIMGV